MRLVCRKWAKPFRRERPNTAAWRLLEILVDMPPLRWWLRDSVARASFLLTAAYLVRDRDVKLRVYPALAPYLVIPILFAVKGLAGTLRDPAYSALHLSRHFSP